jgi:Na+-driven multidrug efflux pump
MQSAVNSFGSNVVASYTAASKVHNIAVQSLPSLGTAMATYCGQNLGAKRYDRIYAGMKRGLLLCFIASVCGAAICLLGGRFIVSWFVSNPSEEIYTYAMQYLRIATCFYMPLGMIFLYRNGLQGLDQGLIPMLSGLVEMLCRLAVIIFIPASTGFAGVCFADPAAWVGAGIPLAITYIYWKKKTILKMSKESL